jgi:hypothetical protein
VRLGSFWKNYSLSMGEYGNPCLANFKIEFSPALSPFLSDGLMSQDTFSFNQGSPDPASFMLYGTGDPIMLRSSGIAASSVSHGRCEKIN